MVTNCGLEKAFIGKAEIAITTDDHVV